MNNTDYKTVKRKRRHAKVRQKISGTATRPRLSVFRSNTAIYAQLIDDTSGTTLVSADSKSEQGSGVEQAQAVGKAIAQAAQAKKIDTIVFDRGGYLFAGRVKALAEAAREGGLKF